MHLNFSSTYVVNTNFVLQTKFIMSLHESLTISMVYIIMVSILWKWTKVLLLIVNLEMATAVVISTLYMSGGVLSSIMLFILVFFVSEALILLSSLYSSMSISGVVQSSMILW